MQSHPKRKREAGVRGVESLETRALLSGTSLLVPGDVDAADTLDQATQLGVLTAAEIHGSIDAAGTDVDWFAFTLQFPSTVTLTGAGGTFGLYDAAESPAADPFGSVGHRLLSQSTSEGSTPTTLTGNLAAGTYYVAISGIGNSYFHQLIAHSGLAGQTGDYALELSSTQIDTSASADPLDVPTTFGSESGEGNDTAATADDLGELSGSGLVQVTGVIGDDPYYQLITENQNLFAGNDVDLYHFHVDATGTVGLQAEVFAGRIGSRLDAGLTLYRLNPATGSLEFVSGNNNSINPLRLEDGSQPLYFDPVVIAGVTAGDYYLAVSHGLNAVSPLEGNGSGALTGRLDPTESHSASNGTDVGQYVLNVQVVALGDKPEVTGISIEDGEELASAPTVITVQFSEFVNLTSAAYASILTTHDGVIPGVFIRDGKGQTLYPILTSFNPETFEARFIMKQRLAADNYELHLSGKLGVTDLAGSPLQGNSSSGDFVVDFKVHRNSVGTNGNPRLWTYDPDTDGTNAPQQLGTLFPQELQAGVEIDRPAGKQKGRTAFFSDEYQFTALQNATYVFRLNGLLAGGLHLGLVDADGNPVDVAAEDDYHTLYARLNAGVYTVQVTNNGGHVIPALAYRVSIVQVDTHDNAPPLSVGPAPTVGMKLSGMSDPVTGGDKPGTGPSGPVGVVSRPGSGGLGGIVNNSVPTTATATGAPGYLSLRNGLPQFNLADGQQNAIIAIPTVTNQSGTTSGMIFRAARSGRLGMGERDTLAPRGLSSLADGPVGREGGLGELLNRSDVGGRSLQALINAAVSNERNVATDKPADSQDNQASNDNDARGDDNVDAATGEAVTASDPAVDVNAGQSGSRKVTKRDPGFLLDAISMLYDGRGPVAMTTDAVSQTTADSEWNADPALIVSAEEYSSFNAGSQAGEINDSDAADHLTDKLFGVGLGLLLTGLFLPRTANKVTKSAGYLHHSGSRRAATLCELQEDSGA